MTTEPKVFTYSDGTEEWILNGKLHREDGPAVIWEDGTKEWYINGKLHREDGPAVEWSNGSKTWYIHGKRHRVDGPAMESNHGYKYWYIDDIWITEEVNQWREEMGITHEHFTPEESVLFMLYFGNKNDHRT